MASDYYTPIQDEARRFIALEGARDSLTNSGASDAEIVGRAERFEEYLKNGAQAVADRNALTVGAPIPVQMQPKPAGPGPQTLEKPKHSTPINTCLACRWEELAADIKAAGNG